MNQEILQVGRLSPAGEADIQAAFKVSLLSEQADPEAFLVSEGHRFHGLITIAPIGASKTLLSQLPNLKVIACRGIGVEKIDLDVARDRGISVSSTPDVLTDCVADLAVGLIIDTVRRISAADRFARSGKWRSGPFPLATRVSGKKLGILGMGKIGSAIAQRALGFQMEIRYHNRRPLSDCPYPYESSAMSLARWADFLMVAVSGGPHSRHLVNRDVLAALGPQGYLFNISRGLVIDEGALLVSLQQKIIAGAGLDVFTDEPSIPSGFMECDQVVITPHIGSGTHETRLAMERLLLDNLLSFFSTGRLLTPVLESH